MFLYIKKNIENFVYIGLYTLSLVLFFFCGGNVDNTRIIFSASHILCAVALFINSDRKIASFLLKSFTIYLLLSNILWAAYLPYVWSLLLFLGIGFAHIMVIDDKDLFGNLEKHSEGESSDVLKLLIWTLVSLAVGAMFFLI